MEAQKKESGYNVHMTKIRCIMGRNINIDRLIYTVQICSLDRELPKLPLVTEVLSLNAIRGHHSECPHSDGKLSVSAVRLT